MWELAAKMAAYNSSRYPKCVPNPLCKVESISPLLESRLTFWLGPTACGRADTVPDPDLGLKKPGCFSFCSLGIPLSYKEVCARIPSDERL